MTGGVVVILGATGWNFGAGLSGGEAFVHDPEGAAQARLNAASVVAGKVIGEAAVRLHTLVARHAAETGSPLARRLLERWPTALREFRHVLPVAEDGVSLDARRRAPNP